MGSTYNRSLKENPGRVQKASTFILFPSICVMSGRWAKPSAVMQKWALKAGLSAGLNQHLPTLDDIHELLPTNSGNLQFREDTCCGVEVVQTARRIASHCAWLANTGETPTLGILRANFGRSPSISEPHVLRGSGDVEQSSDAVVLDQPPQPASRLCFSTASCMGIRLWCGKSNKKVSVAFCSPAKSITFSGLMENQLVGKS